MHESREHCQAAIKCKKKALDKSKEYYRRNK